MMWLLTILMISPDGTATTVPVGLMVNEPICDIAGAGFEAVLHTTLALQDPALDNAPLD